MVYIANYPVTLDDAKRALHIFGPVISHVKGVTTRRPAPPIKMQYQIPMPDDIMRLHPSVYIFGDFVFVQSVCIQTTISEPYEFETIEDMSAKKASKKDILKTTKNATRIYTSRGLEVRQFNGDNNFACITRDMLPIFVNVVATGAHVS